MAEVAFDACNVGATVVLLLWWPRRRTHPHLSLVLAVVALALSICWMFVVDDLESIWSLVIAAVTACIAVALWCRVAFGSRAPVDGGGPLLTRRPGRWAARAVGIVLIPCVVVPLAGLALLLVVCTVGQGCWY